MKGGTFQHQEDPRTRIILVYSVYMQKQATVKTMDHFQGQNKTVYKDLKNELFFSGDSESVKFNTEIKYCISLELVKENYFNRNSTLCKNVCNTCMKKTWEGINVLISHQKSNIKQSLVLSAPITLLPPNNWKFQIPLTNILLNLSYIL